MDRMREEIRKLIAEHGHLERDVDVIGDEESLFEAGMSSHAAVTLMMALEDHFNLEFPDSELKRSNFESVDAIVHLVATSQRSAQ
jgi:acyl carrier protein